MDKEYRINRLKFYIEQLRISTRSDSYMFNVAENDQIHEKIDELERFLL
jgi:hypothetical protein